MPVTRRKFLFGAALAAAGAALPTRYYLRHENNAPELCAFEVPVRGLPPAFHGFRMVLLSDLHAKVFAPDQEPLLSLIRQARPEAVAFAGDMLNLSDPKGGGREVCLDLAAKILGIAPLLWAPGNHEWYLHAAASMAKDLEAMGAMPLAGRVLTLTRQGQRLQLAGTWDYPGPSADLKASRKQIEELLPGVDPGGCLALLSHRPQLMELYKEFGVALALCGHNHGGQIRIPGLGGLLEPGYRLFPRYDAGVFREGPTTLVVTRGLGNSGFPLRINNRPEVAVLTLRRA